MTAAGQGGGVKKDTTERGAAGGAFRAGPPKGRTPLRDNLESIVIAIVLVLVLRQVVVEAFRIQHGSMAPTLLGDHREVRCPNCAYTFNVGLDKSTAEGSVECPNCGYEWPALSYKDPKGRLLNLKWPAWLWNAAAVQGDGTIRGPGVANRVPRSAARIFVDKLVYRLRPPRRWEVVVFIYPVYTATCQVCGWTGQVPQDKVKGFRCPQCGSADVEFQAPNYIKRIAGLPGETVQVADGDVFVGGKVSRKPLDIQSQIWMHVFDSFFMPRRTIYPLWDLTPQAGKWNARPKEGVLEVDARGEHTPVLGGYAQGIKDYYPYDGDDYPGVDDVGDVRIRACVRAVAQDAEGGEAVLSIRDKGHEFGFHLGVGPKPRAVLEDDGIPVRQALMTGDGLEEDRWISLANFDDRVVACVDGQPVFTYDYDAGTHEVRGGPDAVRFGARGADLLFNRIIIDRDVYYTSVAGSATTGYTLKPHEYYVLGDNSPVSSDSRRWDNPGVPAGNIIGKASFVFWPIYRWKLLASAQK
jgi:signal peptidase I